MLYRFIVVVLIIIIGVMWYLSAKRSNKKCNVCDEQSAEFNPYEILQISRNATQEEIRKAWHDLAAQYHPDKAAHLGPDLKDLAEKRFKEIQRAYDMLRED